MINKIERLLSGKSEGLVRGDPRRHGRGRRRSADMRKRPCCVTGCGRWTICWKSSRRAPPASTASTSSASIPKADAANVQVLQVRDGSMSDRRSFFLKNVAGEKETDYPRTVHDPLLLDADRSAAPRWWCRHDFQAAGTLQEFLSDLKGSRVEVRPAVRGKRRELAAMAAAERRACLRAGPSARGRDESRGPRKRSPTSRRSSA